MSDTGFRKYDSIYFYFNYCKFFESADFSGVTLEFATFFRATFETANFFDTKFESANFSEVIFESAEFNKVTFGSAYFIDTEFRSVDFVEVQFGYADFHLAKFEHVDFYEAVFKHVYFRETTFEFVRFIEVKFEFVDFTDTLIGFGDFSYAVFEDIAIFKKRNYKLYEESNDPLESFWQKVEVKIFQNESILILYLVTFKNPQNVTFIDFPLSNMSFLMTDVSDILLICSASEIKKEGILSERLLNGIKINNDFIDEAIETLDPLLRQETVLAEYRNIRKSFEKNRTFAEASELFIREMRMMRQNLSIPEKIVHYIYDGLSRYGESFIRPLGIMIGAIFTLPVIENYFSGDLVFENYWTNLEATARLFFQLPVDHGYGMWEVAIRLLSIILFGNMFIAFRRRLERK
jgi:hypothetical protein